MDSVHFVMDGIIWQAVQILVDLSCGVRIKTDVFFILGQKSRASINLSQITNKIYFV